MAAEDRGRLDRRQDEADVWARESRARTRTDWQRADRERAGAEADWNFFTGLHQNWMRDYDLTTGRYIRAGPLASWTEPASTAMRCRTRCGMWIGGERSSAGGANLAGPEDL